MSQPATISGFGPPPSIAPADPHGINQPKKAARTDGVDIAALTAEVAKHLRSPEVQAVNFRWAHMRIDPAGWNAVADALESGKISLVVDREAFKGVGINVIAYYAWNLNQLTFRNGRVMDVPTKRAVVVHECAHAVHDSYKLRHTHKSSHAMVYLAEAWYRLNAAGARPGGGVPLMKRGIPGGFYQIAQDLRARAVDTAGAVVMTEDEIALALKKFGNRDPSDGGDTYDGF